MTIDFEVEARVILRTQGQGMFEDCVIALRSIATRAREEALEEAAGVCEQWASELGDEHGKLCACMSHNPDACDCWLSEPENRIRALKEKP